MKNVIDIDCNSSPYYTRSNILKAIDLELPIKNMIKAILGKKRLSEEYLIYGNELTLKDYSKNAGVDFLVYRDKKLILAMEASNWMDRDRTYKGYVDRIHKRFEGCEDALFKIIFISYIHLISRNDKEQLENEGYIFIETGFLPKKFSEQWLETVKQLRMKYYHKFKQLLGLEKSAFFGYLNRIKEVNGYTRSITKSIPLSHYTNISTTNVIIKQPTTPLQKDIEEDMKYRYNKSKSKWKSYKDGFDEILEWYDRHGESDDFS